jgi:hypothetical protein
VTEALAADVDGNSKQTPHTVQSTLYYSQLLAEVRAKTAGRSGPLTGNLVSTRGTTYCTQSTYMHEQHQASHVGMLHTEQHKPSFYNQSQPEQQQPWCLPTSDQHSAAEKREDAAHSAVCACAKHARAAEQHSQTISHDTAHTKREKVQRTVPLIYAHYAAAQQDSPHKHHAPCQLYHNHATGMHKHMPHSR